MNIAKLFSAIALGAGLCLTAVGAVQAQDLKLMKPGVLVIGTTGSSPPATMFDAKAELIGLDIDLSKKIAADLGLKPEFVTLDWAGMLAGIQAGRFDMVASSVARTPERVASADFIVSSAYLANGVSAAIHRTNTAIKGWKDLCGKTVGIVKGANQIVSAKQEFGDSCFSNIREYPGWTELLLDLQNRRIDALVGNYVTPAYLIASTNRPLAMLPDTLAVSGNALVIRKQSPELAAKIEELLTRYKQDGTLAKITETWVGKGIDLAKVAK